MTNLKGSEKQIAWAESIREKMITKLTKGAVAQKDFADGYVNSELFEAKRIALIEAIENQESSVWFIENRAKWPEDLIFEHQISTKLVYNRSKIMKKAHRYMSEKAMSKSEALKKAWAFAKKRINSYAIEIAA